MQLAAREFQNTVAATGEVEVVSDVDGRKSVTRMKIGEEINDAIAGGGIEVAGGLVGEEEAGAGDEGAGEGDALLLAAGEFAGAMGEAMGESDFVEGGGGAGQRVAFAADEERHGDVLLSGELGEERLNLPDEADVGVAEVGELIGVELGEVLLVEEDLAGSGVVESAEEMEEGGLAGAGSADQGDAFAGRDGEGEVAEDGEGSGGGLIGLSERDGFDGGRQVDFRIVRRGQRHEWRRSVPEWCVRRREGRHGVT